MRLIYMPYILSTFYQIIDTIYYFYMSNKLFLFYFDMTYLG